MDQTPTISPKSIPSVKITKEATKYQPTTTASVLKSKLTEPEKSGISTTIFEAKSSPTPAKSPEITQDVAPQKMTTFAPVATSQEMEPHPTTPVPIQAKPSPTPAESPEITQDVAPKKLTTFAPAATTRETEPIPTTQVPIQGALGDLLGQPLPAAVLAAVEAGKSGALVQWMAEEDIGPPANTDQIQRLPAALQAELAQYEERHEEVAAIEELFGPVSPEAAVQFKATGDRAALLDEVAAQADPKEEVSMEDPRISDETKAQLVSAIGKRVRVVELAKIEASVEAEVPQAVQEAYIESGDPAPLKEWVLDAQPDAEAVEQLLQADSPLSEGLIQEIRSVMTVCEGFFLS